jgi:hypothetical protein
MAKQTDTQITGTFGDFIYYERNGQFYKRAKGNTGRQAEIAKKQSALLGKASAISAKIRSSVKPLLSEPANRQLMYRLNRVLQQWLREDQHHTSEQINYIVPLHGFSFSASNENDFMVAMPVVRTTEGNIALQIPSFDSPNPIYPLPFEGNILLHIIATTCRIENPSETERFEHVIDIAYDGTPIPANVLNIPLITKQGWLTTVALSINKSSAGIVGALFN